ncbi:MAG: glycosyltransferase family 4 protein [Candidatus Pacebacteria bacterium]|nr:glycosyltransferase family 4 protein [Candidatus Paceibacterota bacterium]MBP9058042.1 glycosyltransferase family 4 protein [Candidatus Paceibacterota bacterium]MBP9770053.1 glycosyltransferase family 4 protein [Candidatus Paceibacterota bacterium]
MKDKKMFLIFHGRFPSEKAASLFAGKSAEAFAREGIDVTLIVPRRFGRVKSDPFEYFSLEKNFEIKYLPTIDLFSIPFLKRFAFRVSLVFFSFTTLGFVFGVGKIKDSIIYSNETLPLMFLSLFSKNCFYEMHDFPEKKKNFYKKLFFSVRGIIVHNRWKMENIKKEFGVPDSKLFYEPNAVELEQFDINLSKEEARGKLGLPHDKKIVVYTGHLYGWKGTDTLAKAGQLLKDINFYFVGGTSEDVDRYQDKYESHNIIFAGNKKHSEIPLWQKSADLLVIPNSAREPIGKFYTSPMKLFEYMASKTPILASRVPAIEELVDPSSAFFFEPDNEMDLKEKIDTALTDDSRESKALSAYNKVLEFTWQKRAGRIMRFLEKNNG